MQGDRDDGVNVIELIRFCQEFTQQVVVIDESFIIKDEEYKSSMILLLEIDSLNDLLDHLGIDKLQ